MTSFQDEGTNWSLSALTVLALLILMMACGVFGCAPSSSSGGAAVQTAAPPPSIDPEPGLPLATPTPMPAPNPTPTPAPLAYNCVNHPLTGRTLTNDNYKLVLLANCTYTFNDIKHITTGNWSPDPDPTHVTMSGQFYSYLMNFTPSGSYICLPASGPQTCANTGFAGSVKVTADINDTLVIEAH